MKQEVYYVNVYKLLPEVGNRERLVESAYTYTIYGTFDDAKREMDKNCDCDHVVMVVREV